MRIDSHQHFWSYNPVRDSWITEDMSVIRKDFLPADLQPILKQHSFDCCVTVQSEQSEADNIFHLTNAEGHEFIKGVVGWVDLRSFDLEERLAYYSSLPLMKGFRHVLQGEADRALMIKPEFKNGISLLSKYGFTYDILIYPDQLRFAYQLASQLPNQKFVMDHIAKPPIKAGEIADWKRDIQAFAPLPNVSCKISGMVTETNFTTWKGENFTPYIDVVVETFGTNRIMYGSDWPVCLVAGGYEAQLQIAEAYFQSFTQDEQDLFFGEKCRCFLWFVNSVCFKWLQLRCHQENKNSAFLRAEFYFNF